jgi:hypothetical protein
MISNRSPRWSVFGLSLFLVVGLVFLGACKKTPSEKASEKILENYLSKATGGKADIDIKKGEIRVKTAEGETVLMGGGGVWPIDLPEDVVKFDAGTIKGVTNSKQDKIDSWMVVIEKVEEDAVTKYVDDLKGEGWNVLVATSMPNGTYTQIEKNKINITLSHSRNDKVLGLNILRSKED